MEQRDILGHQRNRMAQAVLGDRGDVLAVDLDRTGLRLVETLQQRQHGGFTRARFADQTDPLARLDMQVEVIENRPSARVGKRHAFEVDPAALRHELGGAIAIRHAVRLEQGANGFREPCDVLRDVDQRHGQIARAVQNREAE